MKLKQLSRVCLGAVMLFSASSSFAVVMQDGVKAKTPPTAMTQAPKASPKPNVFSTMSKEQRKKIRSIAGEMRKEMSQATNELRQSRDEMKAVVMNAKFDDAKAKALADKQGKLYAKMIYLRMKTRHQVYQVMTPEQRKQLEQRTNSFKRHPMKRMGPGPVKKPQ